MLLFIIGIHAFIPILNGFHISGVSKIHTRTAANTRLFSQANGEYNDSKLSKPSSIIEDHEVDFVVIGSGIGGLSAAAMLSYYGHSVSVLESHYLPGGVAHTYEQEGFKFDAGQYI